MSIQHVLLLLPPPERPVSAPHGDAGRPPQLRPAAAAPRGARGRRDQRLPDGAARRRPLRPLQGGKGHRGQEGQPQRQGTGEDDGGGRTPPAVADFTCKLFSFKVF